MPARRTFLEWLLGLGTGSLAEPKIESAFDLLPYEEAERLVTRRVLWELVYQVSVLRQTGAVPPALWNDVIETAINKVRITHDAWQPTLWDEGE